MTLEFSVNSPICLPSSVLAEVDGLPGATELEVVVHAESNKRKKMAGVEHVFCPYC